MDQRRAEIVKTIAVQRQRLGDDLTELERQVRKASDWRTYFAANTWTILGLAVGVGFLISGMFTRSPR
jgi:ElaB/YqjD/DUF883 family membrane-anchored ribosome-binding protein